MRYSEIKENNNAYPEAYLNAARENVEMFLGDVVDDPSDFDGIKEAAYSLAHDAVIDIGGSPEIATQVALKVQEWYS